MSFKFNDYDFRNKNRSDTIQKNHSVYIIAMHIMKNYFMLGRYVI